MMKKLGIWLGLTLLAVSIATLLGSAQPKSVEYYDLTQYSFPSGDYMHVAVSPRGDDIYVGLGRRLITIDADQGVLARIFNIPRDSVVDFGIPNYVEFTEADAKYCYVSTGSRLRVFHVQPPWRINREPTPVKSVWTLYTNQGMVRSGNTLYVTGAEWFYIYNIMNPNAPVLLNEGHLDVGGYGLDIAIEGNYAFLSTTDGLRVVHIPANKKRPKVMAKRVYVLNMGSHAGIAVFTKNKKKYVLLTRADKGLYIYEYDPDNTPSQIRYLRKIKEYRNKESSVDRSIGITEDVAVLKIDGAVYALIGTTYGLFVADVTAPNRPSVVGYLLRNNRTSATYDVVSIAVRGTTAYLAERVRGYHVGIRVVDVSKPVGGGTYK
jgi:hypothetical protein